MVPGTTLVHRAHGRKLQARRNMTPSFPFISILTTSREPFSCTKGSQKENPVLHKPSTVRSKRTSPTLGPHLWSSRLT